MAGSISKFNKLFFLICFALILFTMVSPPKAFSFGSGTHTWIASQAFDMFSTNELNQYKNTILRWSWEADYWNYNEIVNEWVFTVLAAKDHFWDVDNNLAYPICMPGFPSWTAYDKATFYWNLAIQEYTAGRKENAYGFLGIVTHFLSDMGSPAHVHIDDHALCALNYSPECDYIEQYLESNYYRWGADRATEIPNYTLHGLMYYLNQQSSWFPSNDFNGNDVDEYGNHHPEWHIGPEYSPSDLTDDPVKENISSTLVPLTIRYVAGLYKLFIEQFQTTINAPNPVQVLDQFTVYGGGTVDGVTPDTWEWDFDYDGTNFTVEATEQNATHLYKTTGTKRIAMRATASGHDPKIVTQDITVKQYPINITAPDGYEDLHRHFSTPESSLITQYTWNYGDGTPTETGRTKEHTYVNGGFYTVTLILTLDDGSSLHSEEGIFVGSGTRYIQGHTIYGDETWYSGGTYIVQGSITVAQGGTLTIQQGVRVELNNGVQIDVYGTLTATGVTFTWADGVNPWRGIRFLLSGSSNSRLESCTFEHASGTSRYASDEPTSVGVIYIWNTSPVITGCTIHNSTAIYGIWIRSQANPVISNCSISGFTNASGSGIHVDYGVGFGGSLPTVTGNEITSNNQGIFISQYSGGGTYQNNTISGNTNYGLYYSGTNLINATNNNWGHPSGPLDPSDDRATDGLYNPTGLGDKVSDKVNYYPWTGMTIGQTAIPTGLSGTASYNSVYLTWNANTEPYLGGYKIYYGTSPNNYNKSKIVGIVTSDTLTGLTNGTPYYIAISSLNSVGVESAKSAEITVTPKATFNLSVTKSGNGSVSATGLTCSGDSCSGTYNYNTQVVITATPGAGSMVAWTGCNSINGNQCTVTMNTDKTVTATFNYTEYLLTVTKSGTGSGNITDDKGNLACNGNLCTGSYAVNTQVTLTAEADAGSAFDGWTGLCNGTGMCTITMDSAKSVAASLTDTEAPDLTVSTLSDGSWTNNETLNLSGTATDNMGVDVLTLTINEIPVVLNPDGTFSYALILIAGPNTINTIATDLAGLQATDTRTINFDLTAPYIEITTPADNSKTKQSTIEVSGTVDESSVVDIKVNDNDPLPAQMNGNNFTLTVPLMYGINTIEVIATDLAGNNSSLKRTMTYDDQGPALSITEPGQDIKTNQSSMLIKGTISDITTANVTVTQDQEVFTPPVTNGSFEQLITFTTEKMYQIYITATDELGNETTVQRNIIYDTTPPSLSLDAVTSPTNQNSQVLTGTVEATAEVTVICPTATVGTVEYPTQTTWSVMLSNMAEGSNMVTVTAIDEAGNVSGQTGATIVVDTIAPDTTITSAPGNPSNTTSASFGFSSTDSNSTFQCQMDNDGYQLCASPKTYTNLSDGSHTLSVIATDEAGNTDPTPATYSWTITQIQMPDLSGNWKSLTTKFKGKQISGTLKVTNSGNANAGSFSVTYYLSDDGITPLTILSSRTVTALRAGRSTNLSFSYNTTTSLSGKYIIAVIDSVNQIAESNEDNNTAAARIP